MCVFIIKHTVSYISQSVVCHTKNSFENNPLDSYISAGGLCLNMEWSHRVTVLGVVCGVFIHL